MNELRLADPQVRQHQVQGFGYTAQVHYFDGKVAKQLQFLSFMGTIYKVLTCSKCETHLFSNTRTFVLDEFVNSNSNSWRHEKRGVVCLALHHERIIGNVRTVLTYNVLTKRKQSCFCFVLNLEKKGNNVCSAETRGYALR